MAPLDDELRAALRTRADALAPSPDPLAGIERRARGIRRRRIAASVAGAALAVSAVAVGATALQPAGRPGPAPFASPSVAPSGAAVTSQRPRNAEGWPTLAGTSAFDVLVKTTWAAAHRAKPADVSLEVLYRGVTGDAGQVGAYQLWTSVTPARIVIAAATNGRTLLLTDEVAKHLIAYRAIVPGLAVPWVVVVGSPDLVKIEYAENGVDFVQQPGTRTALFARTGPNSTKQDEVRLLDRKGFSYTTPANPPGPTDGAPGTSDGEPTNLLGSWPERGDASAGPDVGELKTRFAQARNRAGEASKAQYRSLWSSMTTSGVRYTVGQAWFTGDPTAIGVSFATGGTNGPAFFLGRATPADPALLAFVIDSLPGATTDLLVVVPRPGTGQVSYAATATGRFTPEASGRSDLNGVGLIDRSRTASGDRLEILDGDGNLDKPLYRGPVTPLLCGQKGCG